MDALYAAQRGRDSDEVVRLSGDALDELWLLCLTGPIIVTDMRAQSIDRIFLSDASGSSCSGLCCAEEFHEGASASLPQQGNLEQAAFTMEGVAKKPQAVVP